MLAVRMRGVGRFFNAPVEIDGAERPREAWRVILKIAGIEAKALRDFNTQRTTVVDGHALRDVTLDIEHGSVVCLIGPSGSGKSVLLRVLAGVIPPTAGRIEIFGPVTPLLDVGGNLEETMTASEHIEDAPEYRNGTADERERFTAAVISFAELEGFEDVALRTFSTGMRLRLSVALALCGRPSIVLIDDVLAVGDIAFQQKVVDRIHELKEAGCTLILALSDDALVRQLATRVIGLAAGRVVSDTTPAHWADAREAHGMGSSEWQITDALPEDDVMSLAAIDVARADQTPPGAASAPGEAGMLDLSLTFDAKAGGLRCRPSVFIARGKTVLFRSVAPAFIDVASPRRFTWQVRLPVHMLTPGRHAVLVNMQTIRGDLVYAMKAPDAVGLVIDGNGDSTVERGTPLMRVDVPWEIESLEGAAQPA